MGAIGIVNLSCTWQTGQHENGIVNLSQIGLIFYLGSVT